MWNFSLFRGSVKQVSQTLSLILLLRKSQLPWLFIVNQANCHQFSSESDSGQAGKQAVNMVDDGTKQNNGNDLVLYYNQYSFYSQKVVMALHEKNLPFESHLIDLTSNEQYKPWFLQINPKGEVPVLQDSGKIIPDSSRIIDYLDDNFSNGNTPRLIPMDQGVQIKQKVVHFRNLIETLNGNVLTVGTLLHPEVVTGSRKIPFIGPVCKQLVNAENNSAENLRKYAELNPESKTILLEKAMNQEKKHERLLDKEEFLKILQETDNVLDEVEKELTQHTEEKKNWWLCTDKFTVADISLTILLVRLNQIGMGERFWANGKRPHLEEYFTRVQERESYQQTIPTTYMFIKTVFISQAPLILGVGIAALVAVIVGGYFVVKKIIHK
ncbi:hypothetical protein GWI33_019856 [Rhynchophorus ferrugineus]|uniref:Ganglioside-induced differentiation-associated protein 1 n=1 Tax=Rhynchophorus ferrugineus TaxID=354439 RepID=A0A834HSI0_RHYFE|nr:hypothetical protein GWI33_019856 [Rhynchophorus ferrugineus]